MTTLGVVQIPLQLSEMIGLAQGLDIALAMLPAAAAYWQLAPLIADPAQTILVSTTCTSVLTWLGLSVSDGVGRACGALANALLFGTAMLYVLAVLLGAPVLSLWTETAALCFFCSMAGLMPLMARSRRSLLPTRATLRKPGGIYDHYLRDNPASARTIGTLAGAYLGCVPIPLDWDRPWQRWPVTPYIGACIGLAIGTIVGVILSSARDIPSTASTERTGPQRRQRKVKSG